MQMNLEALAELRGALFEDQPYAALRKSLVGMRTRGLSLVELEALLNELREEVEGDEVLTDVILDHLDYVTGYCSPHLAIK